MKYELYKSQPTVITNLPLHKFVCAIARQLRSFNNKNLRMDLPSQEQAFHKL